MNQANVINSARESHQCVGSNHKGDIKVTLNSTAPLVNSNANNVNSARITMRMWAFKRAYYWSMFNLWKSDYYSYLFNLIKNKNVSLSLKGKS